MHVLVTGAGIMGSIYGWALAEGGHDVVHFVRPGRATALRAGLALDLLDRRKARTRKLARAVQIECGRNIPISQTIRVGNHAGEALCASGADSRPRLQRR